MNMTANRATELRKALRLPKAKVRLLKVESRTMGSFARASTRRKRGNRRPAAPNPAATNGLLQPWMPPRVSATSSPVSPPRKARLPATSSRCPFSSSTTSRRLAAAHAVPTAPSGTLNQKTQCQEMEVITPPTTTPRVEPAAAIIMFIPSARPSSREGKASATMTLEVAIMNAPAAPMSVRAAMSCPAPPTNPASRLTAVKSANPPT
jgi:hypothetical protein